MGSENPLQRGRVHVNPKKVCWTSHIPKASTEGQIHIGMMGATVVFEDGTTRLYPWRVIDWVEFDAPQA